MMTCLESFTVDAMPVPGFYHPDTHACRSALEKYKGYKVQFGEEGWRVLYSDMAGKRIDYIADGIESKESACAFVEIHQESVHELHYLLKLMQSEFEAKCEKFNIRAEPLERIL